MKKSMMLQTEMGLKNPNLIFCQILTMMILPIIHTTAEIVIHYGFLSKRFFKERSLCKKYIYHQGGWSSFPIIIPMELTHTLWWSKQQEKQKLMRNHLPSPFDSVSLFIWKKYDMLNWFGTDSHPYFLRLRPSVCLTSPGILTPLRIGKTLTSPTSNQVMLEKTSDHLQWACIYLQQGDLISDLQRFEFI